MIAMENTRASIWTTDFNRILYGVVCHAEFMFMSMLLCCCVVLILTIPKDRHPQLIHHLSAVHCGKCGNVAATSFVFGFLFSYCYNFRGYREESGTNYKRPVKGSWFERMLYSKINYNFFTYWIYFFWVKIMTISDSKSHPFVHQLTKCHSRSLFVFAFDSY